MNAWVDSTVGDAVADRSARTLLDRLAGLGSVLVALSGGADSALVVAAAARALGPGNVVAATAHSASLARGELDAARRLAEHVGVRWRVVRTEELARDGYRSNDGDRCYHCKAELLDVLLPVASELGVRHVATGTNADDVRAGFRPGIRAASERGAVTPLADAGLGKAEVRTLSRAWGLPTWDKPAAACLSSRVAFGVTISARRLERVDGAEAAARRTLAQIGATTTNLRVRDLGADGARIELDPDLAAGLDPGGAALLCHAVREAGFSTAQIDPRGFRSGSMNELLADPERFR